MAQQSRQDHRKFLMDQWTFTDGSTAIVWRAASLSARNTILGLNGLTNELEESPVGRTFVVAKAGQLSKSIVLARSGTARPDHGWFSVQLVGNHGADTGVGAAIPFSSRGSRFGITWPGGAAPSTWPMWPFGSAR